jgi:hypothetical protein
VQSAYNCVHNTHASVAQRRAIERAEHIHEVFDVDGSCEDVLSKSGWVLCLFGVRENQAAEATFEMEGMKRLVDPSRSAVGAGEADMEEHEPGEGG